MGSSWRDVISEKDCVSPYLVGNGIVPFVFIYKMQHSTHNYPSYSYGFFNTAYDFD